MYFQRRFGSSLVHTCLRSVRHWSWHVKHAPHLNSSLRWHTWHSPSAYGVTRNPPSSVTISPTSISCASLTVITLPTYTPTGSNLALQDRRTAKRCGDPL